MTQIGQILQSCVEIVPLKNNIITEVLRYHLQSLSATEICKILENPSLQARGAGPTQVS